MKKMRTLLILMITLLAVTCPVSAASQRTAVKKVTTNYLKAVKTLNDKKMAKYSSGEEAADASLKQSTLFKTIRRYNKRYFSYKIKAVTISGDQTRASVKVSLKYKSLYKPVYKSILQTMQKAVKLAQKNKEMSERQIFNDIGRRMKKNIKKYPPKTKTARITLNLIKTDAGWKIDNTNIKNPDPFVCDMMKGIKKAEKAFEK